MESIGNEIPVGGVPEESKKSGDLFLLDIISRVRKNVRPEQVWCSKARSNAYSHRLF